MDPKYIEKIQRWVELDNKIETRKLRLKEYTDEKKTIEDDILSYIQSENIKDIQINTSDGFIQFQETKQTGYITLKLLKETIFRYFDNNTKENITPENLYDFIISNRETKTKINMKRHITS